MVGDNSKGGTPVPIPNTAVKPLYADGTVPATGWKSRKLPTFFFGVYLVAVKTTLKNNPKKTTVQSLYLFLILFFLFVTVTQSYGMYIRYHYQIIAWSTDGGYMLLHETSSGPEGGGELSYHIMGGKTNYSHEKFALSNSLSDGNSNRERISFWQYHRNLKNLERSLKAKQFRAFSINYLERRDRALDFSQSKNSAFVVVPFLKKGDKWTSKDLILTFKDDDFLISKKHTILGRTKLKLPENTDLEAFLSPLGNMVIIFFHIQKRIKICPGLFYSKKGLFRKMRWKRVDE